MFDGEPLLVSDLPSSVTTQGCQVVRLRISAVKSSCCIDIID
jgi:hypothetical protein